MDKLSVLHVYRTYYPDPPGGLQEAIRQIAHATRANGVSSKIFTLSPNPEPSVIARPEAVVYRSRSLWAPASCELGGRDSLVQFARLACEVDIIHYHFPWPFADLLAMMARPNVPSVMTYHSDIVRQRWLGAAYKPLMYRMLRKMSAVVTTSPRYAATSPVLSSWDRSSSIRVIPLGLDENTYPSEGEPGILRRLGIRGNEPFLLFLGVLRYYKGLDTLVRAASHTRGKIVIAGEGPEAQSTKEMVRRLGLVNVHFAGQVSDAEKVTLLRHCRALVLPSHLRSEAYGMVLVEASMFSKPMISCEIGTGTSFINMDGETGFVVPPSVPLELARAMNRLLHDEALSNHLGRCARLRYEQNFSGAAFGEAYSSLYKELLGNRAK